MRGKGQGDRIGCYTIRTLVGRYRNFSDDVELGDSSIVSKIVELARMFCFWRLLLVGLGERAVI